MYYLACDFSEENQKCLFSKVYLNSLIILDFYINYVNYVYIQ